LPMPAKRLPWIKFWPELLEHRKFGELTDSESWTWVVVWGKASQQPERWTFASLDHAARATGRKRQQIQRLVDIRLIDIDGTGRLTIHDVKQWQDQYPSDGSDGPESSHHGALNGAATLREHSPEDSANAPSTLREDPPESSANTSLKTPRRLREHSPEDSANAPPEKGEERRESTPPLNPPQGGGRAPVPKPRPERTPITDQDIEDLVGKYAEQYGSRQAVRDEIELALNHTARFRSLRERLYVDGWLRRELAHRPGWRVINGRSAAAAVPRQPVDRTGVAN
jgi:hypothetical protein